LNNESGAKTSEQTSKYGNSEVIVSELTMVTSNVTLKLNKKRISPSGNNGGEHNSSSAYKLFRHFELPKRDYSIVENFLMDKPQIHPSFIKLGIQYAHNKISGSNSRCLALLDAFKDFINDYKVSSRISDKKTISKDIESKLKQNIK
jgi:hypothetical protein